MTDPTLSKKCTKCGERKELAEFHCDRSRPDGRRSRCKLCHRAQVNQAARTNEGNAWQSNYNRSAPGRSAARRYLATPKSRARRRENRARPAGRIKENARNKLRAAVRRGDIEHPDGCSKCRTHGSIEAHHPDYSKPLDVVWLCRACHVNLHRRLGVE